MSSNKIILPITAIINASESNDHATDLALEAITRAKVAPENIIVIGPNSQKASSQGHKTNIEHIYLSTVDLPKLLYETHIKHKTIKLIAYLEVAQGVEENWLENIYNSFKKHPNDLLCNVGVNIACDLKGNILSTEYWFVEVQDDACYQSLMPITKYGFACPATELKSLPILDSNADSDLVLKAKFLLQNTQCRIISKNNRIPQKASSLNITIRGNLCQEWRVLSENLKIKPFDPIPTTINTFDNSEFSSEDPIDAVITWVDGSDPKHATKLNNYVKSISASTKPIVRKTRFSDDGEINLCIHSILKNAPWIRKIFIVTDDQTPEIMQWIKNSPFKNKIKIVDHKLIFENHLNQLPTFNTRSITAMLWQTPGIAEKFIYFNDDYILAAPVKPADFYIDNKVILRGKWRLLFLENLIVQLKSLLRKNKIKRPKHSTSQRLAATVAGFKWRYFFVRHNPHPFLKSTWADFYTTNPELFESQLSHKLRSAEQFNADAISAHLNLKKSKAVIKTDIDIKMIQPESQSKSEVNEIFREIEKHENIKFICAQSIDKGTDNLKTLIFSNIFKLLGSVKSQNH